VLAAMIEPLTHRGPDDHAVDTGRGFALGFRRLSIVDLLGGKQPMRDCSGAVRSVVNGEIYNYKELREELVARGCVFRTNCDVEVIPHLYEIHGETFVEKLNGQFAIAIVDERRRKLVLARDHVGIAPLFYTFAGETLLFASEIKALLRHPGVKRAVDLIGLDQILTWPGPVSPRTMFAGISSLPPGHTLVFSEAGTRIHKYWDLDFGVRQQSCRFQSDGSAVALHTEAVEHALTLAVKDRLNADVPVGFYLSGGLDSSLIAALMHARSPEQRRHSFSITFTDAAIDERRYQRLMAQRVGSIHHEREVGAKDIGEHLRRIVRCAEAPLRESYNACSLMLSGLAAEHGLKVILTGEGADEIFGGYVGYNLTRDSDEDDLESLLEAQLRKKLFGDRNLFYEKNYRAASEVKRALYAKHIDPAEIDCLAHAPVDHTQLIGRHPFHQRSYLDFKLRLADHLLADHGDRVAYANSVEVRYPFLDLRVIEAAKQIPPELMNEGGEEKAILRRVAARHVPPAILERRKFSFVAPSSPHLLRDNDWLQDLVSRERIARQGYFDPDVVEHLRARRTDINQTFEDDLLMVVLTFAIFLEEFGL
jgi:asparagine synthase (glutamine-hydrolysing)